MKHTIIRMLGYSLLLLLGSIQLRAQEAAINIVMSPATIAVGQTGTVEVTIYNNDFFITIPANKLLPVISVPSATTIIPAGAAGVGINPDSWTVVSQTGTSITMTNSQPIGPGTVSTYYINVVGTAAGGLGIIGGTLNFNGATPPGDLAGNNSSQSSVIVAAPLPVSLTAFKAVKQGGQSLLKWNTATEVNNDGFTIERSADSKAFSKIGRVRSKAADGSSNTFLDYSFTDVNPLQTVNYYRLCQTDKDGKVVYSHIEEISFDDQNSVRIYPNPASNTINISGVSKDNIIRITDITGKVVLAQKAANSLATINLGNLSNDIYLIQVVENGKIVYTQKVVKK